jgi:hypothetical protein
MGSSHALPVTDEGVVDVRGLRPDGQWTEWLEAPGTQGTSNIRYRIASGKHVAKAYVAGVSGATRACI